MRKRSVFLLFFLVFVMCVLTCATDSNDSVMNNAYGSLGVTYAINAPAFGGFTLGAGYEREMSDSFSLGAYTGMVIGEDDFGFDLLLKPKYYFSQFNLDNLFVGANLGATFSPYETYTDYGYSEDISTEFVAGLNVGYKFILGGGPDGFTVEPSIGYDFLPGRISAGLAVGYSWGGSRPAPRPAPTPAAAPRAPRDGIYIGIITFGPNAVDITNGPIYLDRDGFNTLNGLLDSQYQKDRTPGTALYYAAQLALANMKKAESRLPQLQSVTMFTFTDGIEISSTGGSLAEIDDPGNRSGTVFRRSAANVYPNFLRGEVNAQINGMPNINRRRINGGEVEAYIAAVQGDDVTDLVAFNTGLDVLSTANSSRYRNTGGSFAELERMFTAIANDIVNSSTVSTFNMITPEYGPGVKVRMTFGGETTAAQARDAQLYIEGTVTVINNEYWLTDVTYGGIETSAGTRVKGTSSGSLVTYEFSQFAGFNINRTQAQLAPVLKQWMMNEGSSVWQPNSEYLFDPNTMRSVKRNNALVYLVLDKSTSINDNDIPMVQNASKSFIRILYEAYNQN